MSYRIKVRLEVLKTLAGELFEEMKGNLLIVPELLIRERLRNVSDKEIEYVMAIIEVLTIKDELSEVIVIRNEDRLDESIDIDPKMK
jgi:hypothetical protein